MNEIASQQPYLRRLFDGQTLELKAGNSIIGRSEDCDLVLDEPGLSRKHARITVDEAQITLFDLGSLNGTLVNGSEAQSKLSLQHGDIIIFDEIEYELLIPDDLTDDTAEKKVSTAQKDTVVANRHEREREDLIQSEVRVVDDEFLARDATGIVDSDDTAITSISQPTFIIRGIGAAGVKVPLDMRCTEWRIGSSITHEVAISHPSVAHSHATLSHTAGQWLLSADGSGDGLQINGRPTERTTISSGDVISVGDVDCLFVCPREYSDTQNLPQQPDKVSHQAIHMQTFDTSDMTPVGWRENREPSPKRRARTRILLASTLTVTAIAAGIFYWLNIA